MLIVYIRGLKNYVSPNNMTLDVIIIIIKKKTNHKYDNNYHRHKIIYNI